MQPASHTRNRLPDKPTFTSPQSASSPANPKTGSVTQAKDASSSSHLPSHLPIATSLTFNNSLPLSLSKVEWPKDACVKWKVFSFKEDLEMAEREREELLEYARRKIVAEWKEGLLDGLVGRVRRGGDGASELWLFEVGDVRDAGSIAQFSVPGLSGRIEGHFHPSWLYPCPDCVGHPRPCPKCKPDNHSDSTPHLLVPREQYRRPLWLYLSSLRDKLLDRLATARNGCRCGDGMLYESKDRLTRGIDAAWDMDDLISGIIHAQLEISLQPRCLFIHPSLRPSALGKLCVSGPTEPPSLAAVTLLPHGYPAYLLSRHPTSISSAILDPYLLGFGTTSWSLAHKETGWVECWILTPPSLANANKGISIIWPEYLVLQDFSKEALSQHRLPDEIRTKLSQQACYKAPWNSASDLSHHILRNTLDGFDYKLSVDAEAERIVASDAATSDKSSRKRALNGIRLILADSMASYEFTRSAVAARDAARIGRTLSERDKDRDREKVEQEGELTGRRPSQVLAAAFMRWLPCTERGREGERTSELPFDPDVSASTNVDQESNDGDSEIGTVSTRDFAMIDNIPGVALSPEDEVDHISARESPKDTDLASPATVPSVSSMSSIPYHPKKPSRARSQMPGSHEPLTPEAQEEGPFDNFPDQPEARIPVNPSSPTWNARHTTADGASLAIPSLFNPPTSLGTTSTTSRPLAPRSDVSGDEGMDGLGLTEDDFAFYDAPTREPDSPPASTVADGTFAMFAPPAALPSPPEEPIHSRNPVIETLQDVGSPEAATQEPSSDPAAAVQSEGEELFEPAPSTPSDGECTPVAPGSPLMSVSVKFADPLGPLAEREWKDEKYLLGKFAIDKTDFPQIADDLPGQSCFFTWNSVPKTLMEPYSNPHVGLIKRLQGLKRTRSTAFGGEAIAEMPVKRIRCSWIDVEEVKRAAEARRREDHELDTTSDTTLDDDTLVVADEDEEEPEVRSEFVQWPAQLAWTVAILLGHFHLPGFTPILPLPPDLLRAPSPPPIAALTPVSPANFTQMQDNLRKQEDAVNAQCVQLLENPILAEWILRTTVTLSKEIRWTSTFNMAKLKRTIDGAILSTKTLTVSDVVDRLDTVLMDGSAMTKAKSDNSVAVLQRTFAFAVGLDGAVIDVSLAAVRFWDKLSLGPLGGQKDVLAFAIYDRSAYKAEDNQAALRDWLMAIGDVYAQLGYGHHKVGELPDMNIRNGVIAGQLEDLESQLGALQSEIAPAVPHVAVYVFCSPEQLQKVGRVMAGNFEAFSCGRLLVHVLPAWCLLYASRTGYSRPDILDITASTVYDRLLRTVKRTTLRKLYPVQPEERRALQYPAITIAPPSIPQVQFNLEWPLKNADVLTPVAYLHVAYSRTSDWVLAACIDQLGEAHTQRIWSVKQGEKPLTTEALVAKIWAFTWKFARRARKEWQVVIARWGGCTLAEVEAWQSLLKLCTSLPLTVSVFLVSIEAAPWQETLPNKEDWRRPQHSASSEGHSYMVDASGSSYGLCLSERFEISSPSARLQQDIPISSNPAYLELLDNSDPPEEWIRPLYTALLLQAPSNGSFTPAVDLHEVETTMSTTRVHLLYYSFLDYNHVLPSRSKFMLDLLQNYQELALLSREKWGKPIGSAILPWHIAAVVLMERLLSMQR